MLQGWVVIPISLAYLGLLFLVAWFGDRRHLQWKKFRPWIYSLSIAVYCTSWTFYGTVGQAAENTWSFIPIYLAPILVYSLGWPIISRLIQISKREHITSIADFIASRYGKSQGLAVTVTMMAVVGILPYIALQLRAVTMGVDLVAPNLMQNLGYQDTQVSAFVAMILAVFTMLFGTRHIDNTEHHKGMMCAIAFESLVKLFAFLVVGAFVVFQIFSSPELSFTRLSEQYYQSPSYATLAIHMVLACAAVLCLPRQFHTSIVENQNLNDLKTARWVFPSYLVLMALFVLPIAWAGKFLVGDYTPDTFVVQVPLNFDAQAIALLAILGGTSAASAMVIVSTIALTIMVSNDLVWPLLLRRLKLSQKRHQHISGLLLNVRRSLIALLLFGAWIVYQILDEIPLLSVIGLLSFAAIAQFLPAIIGGLFWRKGNKKGVYAGLFIGSFIWLVTLMSHTQMLAGTAQTNFLLWIIEPPAWIAHLDVSRSDWGMALSGIANLITYIFVSLLTRRRLSERMQADSFVGNQAMQHDDVSLYQSRTTVAEIEMLAARFVGRKRMRVAFAEYSQQTQQSLLPQSQAPVSLIQHTERLLAGVFGASSSRLVLQSALQGKSMQLDDVATIVDEASEIYNFSRGLLQGAIEHITQGISVVDKQLRLVAWNQRYLDLFEYPEGFIQVGQPISQIILYNAKRGLCGDGDPLEHVARRIAHLKRGTPHISSRIREDGKVIEVQGNPMPNGGFVMSFTDITNFRNAELELTRANETLEERVQQRTFELEQLNHKLLEASQEAQQATLEAQQALASKNKLLAAVSHDLMQPLNAARLFTSSLIETELHPKALDIAGYLNTSLGTAEDLISDLLDMSRLSAGKVHQSIRHFKLNDILQPLVAEFSVLAQKQGILFSCVMTDLQTVSDANLLRRVLQNLLTNAFRYIDKSNDKKPRVVLGVRRCGSDLLIQVWDNGIGIEQSQQAEIFEEFTRVDQNRADQGLGLGLSIVQQISLLLKHPVSLQSWPQQGSVFSVQIPRSSQPLDLDKAKIESNLTQGICYHKILCVDNDADILQGMKTLLEPWGGEVKLALNLEQALAVFEVDWQPEVIFSDYHLDDGKLGLDVLAQCQAVSQTPFIGVIISANRSESVKEKVAGLGYRFLPKPVKPLKIRSLLSKKR